MYLKNGVNNYIKLGLSEDIESLKSEITSLKSENTKLKKRVTDLENSNNDFENTNNLLDLSTIKKNTTVDTDGVEIEDSSRWLSDFIPVDSHNNEQINFTQGTYRIGLYGEDKNFITRSGVTDSTFYQPKSSTNTKYVRLSETVDLQEMMVNKGSELLPYEEPYGTRTKLKQEF